jgi:RarD protein
MSAPVPVTALEARRGLLMTAASFVIWGLVPLYWHLLKVVPSLQIIAHRIVWSTVLVVAWLLATSGLRWWRTIAAQPRALWMLAGSSVAIALNWGLYIWAINAGHVIEASLGYFINPLLSLLLGVVVLKLFFIELADHGGLYRIVSFIVVGLLLLVVGYFAPVPPTLSQPPGSEELAPGSGQATP